jgi:hypothetical protein
MSPVTRKALDLLVRRKMGVREVSDGEEVLLSVDGWLGRSTVTPRVCQKKSSRRSKWSSLVKRRKWVALLAKRPTLG